MSTPQAWSTVVDQSTDAAFRAWGAEFSAKMLATGTLTQTADTGQINWVTVTRAAINTNAGFQIWYLNDSLHGTAPVYFRIDFGSAGATTAPRIMVTVGTGTNGSGTLTGTALTISRAVTAGSNPTSTVTAYASYMCAVEGFFGFAWKCGPAGNTNASRAFFVFQRSVDTAGAFSAQGGWALWGIGSSWVQQNLRFASTAAAYTVTTNNAQFPCVIPGAVTSSTVGSNFQAYIHWGAFPDVLPMVGTCTALQTEVAFNSTFSVAMVAGVSHTYIQLGSVNSAETTALPSVWGFCMRWE